MGTSSAGSSPAIAEIFANWAGNLSTRQMPQQVVDAVRRSLVDNAGLAISARHEPYVKAISADWDGGGVCTAFGHSRGFDMAGAALINGTAAHGEDYDDTFEGSPMHTGAAVLPAVLAAAQRYSLSGEDILRGTVAGVELMCRLAVVAPTAQHRAGFHPTGVAGTMAAAAAVAVALRMPANQIASALGIAGSLASGIIEYLAEGTWTKRLHPGWAAQSGTRAALLARNGFLGPRTVFEGEHGFFFAFSDPSITRDYGYLTELPGDEWLSARIAFKPYACGTMVQPFIDCAVRLAGQIDDLDGIASLRCFVGEGTVHRLWEPLAEKRCPSTPYSAKFSVPYGVAVGLADRAAGLRQFTQERILDSRLLKLAQMVSYEIDPLDEYPKNYTGRIEIQLKDGRILAERQPHLRGGVREPLSDDELFTKYHANCAFGGLERPEADRLLAILSDLFERGQAERLADFHQTPRN